MTSLKVSNRLNYFHCWFLTGCYWLGNWRYITCSRGM